MDEMSEARHTPGPWAVTGPYDGETDCTPPEPGKMWLTIQGPGEFPDEVSVIVRRKPYSFDEEHEANARLIALAPELLALAERVAGHFENTDAPLGEDARKLLSRARQGSGAVGL